MSNFLNMVQQAQSALNRIKITYSEYLTWELYKVLSQELTIYVKEKEFIYYDKLSQEQQYDVAVYIFQKLSIITYDDQGIAKIKLHTGSVVPLDSLSKQEVIDEFIYYVTNINDIFSVNYKECNDAGVTTKLFMDVVSKNVFYYETDIKRFVLNAYKNYLMTYYESVIFSPRYGTNLKEYLQTNTVSQAHELIQAELDELTSEIRIFLSNNFPESDYSVVAKVEIKEGPIYGDYEFNIYITFNGKTSTLVLK